MPKGKSPEPRLPAWKPSSADARERDSGDEFGRNPLSIKLLEWRTLGLLSISNMDGDRVIKYSSGGGGVKAVAGRCSTFTKSMGGSGATVMDSWATEIERRGSSSLLFLISTFSFTISRTRPGFRLDLTVLNRPRFTLRTLRLGRSGASLSKRRGRCRSLRPSKRSCRLYKSFRKTAKPKQVERANQSSNSAM